MLSTGYFFFHFRSKNTATVRSKLFCNRIQGVLPSTVVKRISALLRLFPSAFKKVVVANFIIRQFRKKKEN